MSVSAFQKEAERMNMTEEAMGDMLSEAFDDDEEETDAVVGQVLAEVGLDTTKNLQDAPTTAALPEPEAAAEKDDTDRLLRQLNAPRMHERVVVAVVPVNPSTIHTITARRREAASALRPPASSRRSALPWRLLTCSSSAHDDGFIDASSTWPRKPV